MRETLRGDSRQLTFVRSLLAGKRKIHDVTSIRIRPRFKKICHCNGEEFQQRIKDKLAEPDSDCIGTVLPNYIVLKVPEKDRHFWSPQLAISLDEHEEGTMLRGLYGPNPTVWALIFYGYAILGILALFFLIAGLSDLDMKDDPTLLWVVPALGVAALILYVIAQFGQKMGVEQTFMIHHFFESCLGSHVHIS